MHSTTRHLPIDHGDGSRDTAPPDQTTETTGTRAHGETRTYCAPYRCATCRTPHASQLEADLCCPANEITDLDDLARVLGRRLGGI